MSEKNKILLILLALAGAALFAASLIFKFNPTAETEQLLEYIEELEIQNDQLLDKIAELAPLVDQIAKTGKAGKAHVTEAPTL